MDVIDSEFLSKFLGHSKAENAFRPWWDRVEDILIYALLLLGLITVPSAMVMGSPLQCTFCKDDMCKTVMDFGDLTEDPGYCEDFVKELCTVNGSVEPFMLFFPFLLLVIALVMVAIEKTFIAIFRSSRKLEQFYSLLERHNLFGHGDIDISVAKTGSTISMEENFFITGDKYFNSYFARTFVELMVVSLFYLFILYAGVPAIIFGRNIIFCGVNGYQYACTGQPKVFYTFILILAIFLIAAYILLNIYNLFWICFPIRTEASRFFSSYLSSRVNGNSGISELYLKYQDLRLFIDLLELKHGISTALAGMAILDKVIF